MDHVTIGSLMCLSVVLVPFGIGIAVGMWLQRRKDQLGMPGAILPGFIRKALENPEWK